MTHAQATGAIIWSREVKTRTAQIGVWLSDLTDPASLAVIEKADITRALGGLRKTSTGHAVSVEVPVAKAGDARLMALTLASMLDRRVHAERHVNFPLKQTPTKTLAEAIRALS